MTYLTKTKSALGQMRRYVDTLLDLRRVSDEHPIGTAAREAFRALESVLDQLAADYESDSGPLVYPIRGEDPRDYPTSRGVTARELLSSVTDPELQERIETGLVLVAPSDFEYARVLTWNEYLVGLRRSRVYSGRGSLIALVN